MALKSPKRVKKSAARARKSGISRTAKKPTVTAPPSAEKVIEEFTAAIKVFQKGDLARAREMLRTILEKHPREREICDRARTYLAVCERSLQPQTSRPRDAGEHYTQGVFLLNQENHEEAVRALEKSLVMEPGNDKALYAKACACARLGRRDEAIEALRQAIESNPSNRILAASDSDLDSLRQLDGFAELLKPGEPESGS